MGACHSSVDVQATSLPVARSSDPPMILEPAKSVQIGDHAGAGLPRLMRRAAQGADWSVTIPASSPEVKILKTIKAEQMTRWRVAAASVPVRSQRALTSDVLCEKPSFAVLEGVRDGDWLRLANDEGYISLAATTAQLLPCSTAVDVQDLGKILQATQVSHGKLESLYSVNDELVGEGMLGKVSQGQRLADDLKVAVKHVKLEQVVLTLSFQLSDAEELGDRSAVEVRLMTALRRRSWSIRDMLGDAKVVLEDAEGNELWGEIADLNPLFPVTLTLTVNLGRGNAQAGIRRELDLLRAVAHPNIVALFDCFSDARSVAMVMSYGAGGDLYERLLAEKRFEEPDCLALSSQILAALRCLHRAHFVHRDVKLENFILTQPGPIGESAVQLIDFNLSRRFFDGQELTTKAGTLTYCSPELLRARYDFRTDLWSFGVLLFAMLSGKMPFFAQSDQELIRRIQRRSWRFGASAWESVSSAAKDLVESLLVDADRRLDSVQAMEHRWLSTNLVSKQAEV